MLLDSSEKHLASQLVPLARSYDVSDIASGLTLTDKPDIGSSPQRSSCLSKTYSS